ncbi:MAG: FadR family transcriptional regulator [Polyangiaceae bacterium]|nr:FadR family transcriptional regulator [Polyangiaceae bacterium]
MVRAPNEVDRVERALVSAIVGGAYPSGLRLPAETELAAQHGCGRSTVREALGRLSTRGLVASRRGSGAHVLDWRREGTPALLPAYLASGVSPEDAPRLFAELLHLRSLLAREATRLAARYAPDASLAGARDALTSLRASDDPVAIALAELRFFRALVTASGVWPAVWLANSFWSPMHEVNALLAPAAGGPPPGHAAALEKLLDLIEAGKEKAALAHLEKLLSRVDKVLKNRLFVPSTGRPSKAKRKV